MKRPHAAWLAVAVLLLSAVLLVLFLPARWAVPWIRPKLHGIGLEQVHGLVWNGAADEVRAPGGRTLGRVRWQLSRSALWGRLDLVLAFDGPQLTARGRLRRDAQGRQRWSDVAVHADLAAWAPLLSSPSGQPQGTLAITLDHAWIQANWPIDVQGQVHWQDAAVRTRKGLVALGNLGMDVEGSHGVLQGQLYEEGKGPLHVQGQWQASPLGWRLDLRLQPRGADPALLQWLAGLGRPAADGSVQLHRRGGLAAAGPEPAGDR